MIEPYQGEAIDVVVGMESRGFIFSSPMAYQLGAGLVPVRKLGKLPAETITVEYALEYGSNTLEIHRDAIQAGAEGPDRRRPARDRRHGQGHDRAGRAAQGRGRRPGVPRRARVPQGPRPPRRPARHERRQVLNGEPPRDAIVRRRALADPTASNAAQPERRRAPGPTTAPDAAVNTAEGDADLGRRKFFRQFAGDIATTAATVMGAAQALQRTSAELAGAILDPTRLEDAAHAGAGGAGSRVAADGTGRSFRTAFRVERASIRLRRPAGAPAGGRRARRRHGGRRDVRDPRRRPARRPGVRPGGRDRDGADRRSRPGDPSLRAPGDVPRRGQRDAQRGAVERIASPRRWTGCMAAYGSGRGAVRGRRRDRGGDAGRGRRDRRRSRRPTTGRSSKPASRCSRPPAGRRRARFASSSTGRAGRSPAASSGRRLPIPMTAHQRELAIRVVVPEGRPRFTGSRVSCLGAARRPACPHLLVADAAAASLIAAGESRRDPRPGRPGRRERRRRRRDRDVPAGGRRRTPRRAGRRLRRRERRDAGRRPTARPSGSAISTPRISSAFDEQGADPAGNGDAGSRPTTSRPPSSSRPGSSGRGSADAAVRTTARHDAAGARAGVRICAGARPG